MTQYDGLLESAFNFLDLNDLTIINRILEDSSQTHVQRAQERSLLKHEKQVNNDEELEANLLLSLQKSGKAKTEAEQKEQMQALKE